MPQIRHLPTAPTRTQVMAAGERIDAHRHDDHQLVYAGSGVLAVTTETGTWYAPGNRAVWVPAGCVHAHRAHGRLDLHLLGLPTSLGFDGPTVLDVGPLLRELILAYTADDVDTPQRRRLRAVLLDQLRAAPRRPDGLPTPRDPRLVAVCALLHEDPADPRTLAQLGTATGAGERTLSRLFARELGMTFPRWRTRLRLYHALRLLADGLPVTTVAHRCGWSSTSAFIDVYARAYGMPPGAHRRLS
ncbi:AraC family transcriptional regulator [Virgisporangium aliadipatigenens]|uniref:HTH-type transcriptional regulator RipA n=1 Tax=Virgisporangium aliadipatigenens TaxID=741659 RepID=A0A8J3YR25_9ACTN|nr:helix-turn-helix transcriptional regulator [Virgisporangium aliadipatigenens]GIJ50269.1 AraC family transcriptional regulator [Virgisporangium aliadipatigenens]